MLTAKLRSAVLGFPHTVTDAWIARGRALPNGCATPVWAVVTSYIDERFPTAVRATGYGIGYSAATIIPAFSSFYMLGLEGLGMPYAYTDSWFLRWAVFCFWWGRCPGLKPSMLT